MTERDYSRPGINDLLSARCSQRPCPRRPPSGAIGGRGRSGSGHAGRGSLLRVPPSGTTPPHTGVGRPPGTGALARPRPPPGGCCLLIVSGPAGGASVACVAPALPLAVGRPSGLCSSPWLSAGRMLACQSQTSESSSSPGPGALIAVRALGERPNSLT